MFTDVGAKFVKSCTTAAIRVNEAQVQLGNAVITDTMSREILINAAIQTIRASRDTSLIVGLLLGGADPEHEERSNHPYSYTELVELAWIHLNRAVNDTLPSAIEAMRSVPGPGREFLEESLSRLDGVLGAASVEFFVHEDPPFEPERMPAVLNSYGRPIRTVFGPHGDYRVLQRHALSSFNYWHGFASQWVDHYIAAPADPRAFGEAWKTYAEAMTLQLHASALLAGISTYWRWDNYDRIDRVLKSFDLLCQAAEDIGAAQLYASCLMAWAKTADSSIAFISGTVQLADSQRHCWRVAREMMPLPKRPRS